MRWTLFTFVVLAGMLLDGGNLLNVLAVGGWHVRPVVLISILAFASLNNRHSSAVICSFMIGLAADIISGTMGPYTLCWGVAGAILNRFGRVLLMKRVVYQGLIVLVCYILTEWPAGWLTAWKTGSAQPHGAASAVLTGLYSAFIAPVLWRILLAVWPKIQKRQGYILTARSR